MANRLETGEAGLDYTMVYETPSPKKKRAPVQYSNLSQSTLKFVKDDESGEPDLIILPQAVARDVGRPKKLL